jgi:glycosyltransferase involved in cell wall biosynthesis
MVRTASDAQTSVTLTSVRDPLLEASKPHLLVLSQIFPFPGSAGQQQRVLYTLLSLRERFRITFVAPVEPGTEEVIRQRLLACCDDAFLLPSAYSHSVFTKAWHKVSGLLYSVRTGLKTSNYIVSRVEFTPARLADTLQGVEADCALFEYWHAAESIPALRNMGIDCVLDMHDILWRSYSRQLDIRPLTPRWWKRRAVRLYREQEERAWAMFDGLITINSAEHDYVHEKLPHMQLFYAPMGIDTDQWPYSWQPSDPPRVAYYGGLGSKHNQQDAMHCYSAVMPLVWEQCPDAQLWLIGGNPPQSILDLARDPRVRVTGYVERVQDVLKTMRAVICPWSGTFGFRSRLIEVMALGVPVVASSDAVYGMLMEQGRGLFLADTDREMADAALPLLMSREFAEGQSKLARRQVEEKFSFDATYGRLADQLYRFVQRQKGQAGVMRG